MYALTLGHYVWLPFAKSLRDRNRSSTLRMKSWFPNDRSTRTIVMGYLILPPTATIEYGNGSTKQLQKLLGLRDHIKFRMRQYTSETCPPRLDDWFLTDTGGGYHLGALNLTSDHSQPSHPVISTTL
jgi:hypothetical protein